MKDIARPLLPVVFITTVLMQSLCGQSLTQAITESDYVISGYVVQTEEQPEQPTRSMEYPDHKIMVARIVILQTIKGKLSGDTIEIPFHIGNPGAGYPTYEDSTYVISCLNQLELIGWVTLNVVIVDSSAIDRYSRQVAEFIEVLLIPDKQQQFMKMVEWVVTNAEYPSLVYRGSSDYGSEYGCFGDWFYFYSRNGLDDVKIALTYQQLQRLRNEFFRRPVDYNSLCLASLVYDGEDRQIERHLLDGLLALPPERYWFAGQYFVLLKHKDDSSEMASLLDEYFKGAYDLPPAQLRMLIEKFVQMVEEK